MQSATRVQTLDEAVCISYSTKGMNLSILPEAMEKYWGRLGSLNLQSQPLLEAPLVV